MRLRSSTAALLLATILPGPLSATTLRVPADHPTVRAAIAAAVSGDTVLVAPGVHVGGAWINGKSVTIASTWITTGDTAQVAGTVLSGVVSGTCGGASGCTGNAVLEFGDNADGSAVVGLTITDGENGITSGSTVDITRCRVIANGDGLDYVPGSGGTIRNSLFADNADDGIDLNGRMTVAILDNDIRDNADDGIEFRLYAYVGATRQVDIVGNRITGNGEDGVQLIDYSGAHSYVVRIERNLFQSNFDGAGLSAAVACMPDGETIENLVGAPLAERVYVINNTFLGESNGVVGGANLIALNNIFSGTLGTALRRVGGNSIASYNLFWSNGTNYTESNIDSPHLIHASPLLDAAGGPTPPSPAIDAGTAFFLWQGEAVLSLPPSGYAGDAPDLGAFESAPNTPPLVSAGPDRALLLTFDAIPLDRPGSPVPEGNPEPRAHTALDGSLIDDGLPYPPRPGAMWSVVSGPGPVVFQNPLLVDTYATFSVPGAYVLRFTASDGLLNASDLVEIMVHPPINMPPIVGAGEPATVTLPGEATLGGMVIDDGLPIPPGTVTVRWTQGSGPGPVTFQDSSLVDTRAAFSVPGTYVLRLAADDGALSVMDSVVITALPVPNTPPVVDAGADQTIMIPSEALLDGTVSDDGLPSPPATVAVTWAFVSGPAPIHFLNPNLADARATFVSAGTYVLRLTATDGALSASDLVQITVLPPPPPLERRISAGNDDAEESEEGRMVRSAADLDLVRDTGDQAVGLRFTGVAVPPGATIISATIQFEADAVHSEATNLVLQGEAADHPASFTILDYNVSSRPRTTASATWAPPPWTVVGEAGPAQRTSDLGSVIQEIIDRPGWVSGNPLVIIITGTGKRTARTQEADPTGAALLHIEYGGLPVQASAGPGGEVEGAGSPTPGPAWGGMSEHASGAQTVSPRMDFAIRGVSLRPGSSLRVEFTLADQGPAALELVDVTGRRVIARDLGALGPGLHAVDLHERLRAGVYLVRLTQGPRAVVRKAVVLE